MVSLTVVTAPAPFRNSTDTVCTPSGAPPPSATLALVEYGWKAPNAPPSTEMAMSTTGSPEVGLDAESARLSVRLLVEAAPPSMDTLPVGAAVSRYRVYEPDPLLLLTTTRPSNCVGSAPVA